MKKIAALVLALITVIFTGCQSENDYSTNITEESRTAPFEVEKELVIAKKGLSDYVIVCNYKNIEEKNFSNDLWKMLYNTYGVSLNTRSSESTYEKEIIIGDIDRDATATVKAQINQENDFAVCAVDDDIVLYATDEQQYSYLLIALRDFIFHGMDSENLVYSCEKNFISSLNPDISFDGNQATLANKGITDYSIVYGDKDNDSKMLAVYLKSYINDILGLNVQIMSDKNSAEHEIIIAGASRSSLSLADSKLNEKDDFSISVLNDDIVIAATDKEMTVLAMMKFIDMCKGAFNGTTITFKESGNYIYSRKNRDYTYNVAEYCERYQSMYNTFSTYREQKLSSIAWLRDLAGKDQPLVEALIVRMGNAAVLMKESSSVLYNGYVRKLNTDDYSLVAHIENGAVMIPKQFADYYFGVSFSADSEGYVNITTYCNGNSEYSIYLSDDSKLAVITPKTVKSFANSSATDGKYTNGQYCERMREFFNSPVFPEPGVNTEQSRVVLENLQYPAYALDYTVQEYQTTYSPGIVVVKENGKSVYYVSYEISTIVNYEELSTFTVVKKSTDGGDTWSVVVEKIPDLRWASPFENDGFIYVIGSDLYSGAAVIAKVLPNGKYQKTVLFEESYVSGTAPGTVLHANGRIYKAYLAATVSAAEDSDLMNPSSWTLSNKTNSESLAYYGNEGSMVLGGDGVVYQVMHTDKPQTAIVLKLSADGTTYTHTNSITGSVVKFPTCVSKTSVIYDEESGKYIALSNICNTRNDRQRNILALVVSEDLVNWNIAEYILVDREMINPYYSTVAHAFQYTDFKIDGEDIVMVIREAAGYTNTYHDGNYCTFYRIDNFRELLDRNRGAY